MRTFVGLPASRDAGVLAKFLTTAHTAIETELDDSIVSFAPVIFPLRSVHTQAFRDALEFASLRSTRFSEGSKDVVFSDTNAAYAGVGAGMCSDWRDYHKCMSKTMAFREDYVLFLNFDNSSFSASVQSIGNPYKNTYIGRRFDFPNLGWWNLPIFEVPRAKFWADVQSAIATLSSVLSILSPNRIVLTGEHGADEEFKVVAEAALWSVLERDLGSMLAANTADSAAKASVRGAAELAWRSNYWGYQGVDRGMAKGRGAIEL